MQAYLAASCADEVLLVAVELRLRTLGARLRSLDALHQLRHALMRRQLLLARLVQLRLRSVQLGAQARSFSQVAVAGLHGRWVAQVAVEMTTTDAST